MNSKMQEMMENPSKETIFSMFFLEHKKKTISFRNYPHFSHFFFFDCDRWFMGRSNEDSKRI